MILRVFSFHNLPRSPDEGPSRAVFRELNSIWSTIGSLQVRAELLNGTLLDRYRVDHPRFRRVSEFVSASD
jgi:hypothetical protein